MSPEEAERQEKLAEESTEGWEKIAKANTDGLSAAEQELEADGGKVRSV
jgi:hypothetical protein